MPDVRIGMFYVYGNSGEQMVAEVDPFFGDLGERDTVTHTDTIFTRRLRFKRYDLKDHGGSTREQYSDLKLDDTHQGAGPYVIDYQFHANYYPFGMIQEGRSNPQVGGDYLYNGKEDDVTWNNGKNTGTGGGNSYDYGARIYNPRLGRWLSGEPLASVFPGISPMAYAANSPITLGDPDGKRFRLLFPPNTPSWQKTVITKAFAEFVSDLSPYSVELRDLANSETEFTIAINTQQDNHFGGIMGEANLSEFRYFIGIHICIIMGNMGEE